MKKKIQKLRAKLDEITKTLINLIAKRKKLVLKLAELKRKNKLPILDRKREREILKEVEKMAKKRELDPVLLKKIIKLLIEDAKKIQKENLGH